MANPTSHAAILELRHRKSIEYYLPQAAYELSRRAIAESIDGIVVCDRNARPIGYAVERMADEYGLELPPLWYVRISKQADFDDTVQTLRQKVAETPLDTVEVATIAVLDDHMSQGTTRRLANKVLADAIDTPHKVNYWTLTGDGKRSVFPEESVADVVGWRDKGDLVGLSYVQGGQVRSAETEKSRAFYANIDTSVQEYVHKQPNPLKMIDKW